MLPEIVTLLFLAAGAGVSVWAVRRWRYRQTIERVAYGMETPEAAALPARGGPLLWRARWLPWLLAALVLLFLRFGLRTPWNYSLAIGLLSGLLLGQVEGMLAQRRVNHLEIQLADMIDLMVGALRAGAGVIKSLEAAVREIRNPLRAPMEELIGRIRLGDEAAEVFEDLAARVPLETFMLFSSTLAVHWEVGGSLAPTLATVGRTIRDRIELSRRVRSMSAQARMSTISVLLASYAIAAIMWANDPDRTERFLKTELGSILISMVLVLQAVGIVWSAALARIKF